MEMKEITGLSPQVRDELARMQALRDKAMSGDIAYLVSPATADREATAAAWTQALEISLVTAAGEVHEWFNGTIATAASVADTSDAGAASISGTSLVFVKGKATLPLTGSAHAWVADETATVTIAQKTILGTTVAQKTHVTTIVAAQE
jgi:hypothetical protein